MKHQKDVVTPKDNWAAQKSQKEGQIRGDSHRLGPVPETVELAEAEFTTDVESTEGNDYIVVVTLIQILDWVALGVSESLAVASVKHKLGPYFGNTGVVSVQS